jgi:hypothetical protein
MRAIGILLAAVALASGAWGQGRRAEHIFDSKDLGIRFAGPFGWTVEYADESGAWTTLATYEKSQYDAKVLLQVRNNVIGSYDAFKKAITEEFKESPADAKTAPGQTLLKSVEFEDTQMKKGAKLPGVEVSATVTRIDKDGKKRESRLFVQTYYGKHRLFRVRATVRRVRYKKVRDQLDAIDLRIDESQEKVTVGTPLYSRNGRYGCSVPEGYAIALPSRKANHDVSFTKKGSGVALYIYSYTFDGDIQDHVDMLLDYYDDEIQLQEGEPKVLGAPGLVGTITRGKNPSYVVGTVKGGRAIRFHAVYEKGKEADAKKLVEWLLKTFKAG